MFPPVKMRSRKRPKAPELHPIIIATQIILGGIVGLLIGAVIVSMLGIQLFDLGN